ncbi:MAG: NrfD/PsrC family molybdoenzyme membrane anchor subunit [Vicinamibacterales bacterium]
MSSRVLAREAVRSWVADKIFMGQSAGDYVRSLATPFNFVAGLVLAVGLPVIVYRFVYGLGAATNLSQTTPWGLWIALDVLCGVALAAGGYTMAAAVYIFGLKQYYPVLRPAILTGFLGYVFVAIGLMVDLGRPYRLPYPIFYSHGLASVMFEVAWCVFLYVMVLGLEFLPAVLEWLGLRNARAKAVRMTMGLVVAGVVLSTLHQSSLGALFLMAPTKVHPLWYSPFIPIFFFVSSIVAGLSMVIFESSLSHRVFRNQVEPGKHVDMDAITIGLGKAASIVLFAYFFLKLQGLADGGHWTLLATPMGYWFLFEILGFVLLPCFLFAHGVRARRAGLVRATAAWTVLGIVVNRFNVSFIAFNWNVGERYFPHWMEIVTSLTIITIGVLVFRWIVNRMPVLREHPAYEGGH